MLVNGSWGLTTFHDNSGNSERLNSATVHDPAYMVLRDRMAVDKAYKKGFTSVEPDEDWREDLKGEDFFSKKDIETEPAGSSRGTSAFNSGFPYGWRAISMEAFNESYHTMLCRPPMPFCYIVWSIPTGPNIPFRQLMTCLTAIQLHCPHVVNQALRTSQPHNHLRFEWILLLCID